MSATASPMQLKYYFIEELVFKANLNCKASKEAGQTRITPMREDAVEASFEHGEMPEDPLKHRIILTAASVEGKDSPWSFRIRVHGFFDASPKFMLKPDARSLLAVNGGSMLYSIAREILFSATGRGPYGAVFLPTVQFAPPNAQPKPAPLPVSDSGVAKVKVSKKR